MKTPESLKTRPTVKGVSLSRMTSDLCAVAQKAFAQDSAAALAVARAALMDIARLHGLGAGDAGAVVQGRVVVLADRPLSEDEWTSLHRSAD